MLVAVSGAICSGKSFVAKELAKLMECDFVDADEIVHDLYRPDEKGWKLVRKYFGKEFAEYGVAVDRKKLGALVFNDISKLKLLNELIHPLVFEEVKEKLSFYENSNFVLEAFDVEGSGLVELIDILVFVERPLEKIIESAVKNRGMSRERVEAILKTQKLASKIDIKIKNDGDLSLLKKRVSEAFSSLSKFF